MGALWAVGVEARVEVVKKAMCGNAGAALLQGQCDSSVEKQKGRREQAATGGESKGGASRTVAGTAKCESAVPVYGVEHELEAMGFGGAGKAKAV